MKAAVFEGNGKLVVKEVQEPELTDTQFRTKDGKYIKFGKEDLVKLKILASGICGTDIGILKIPQSYPTLPNTIIGHEFVGEVVEKGERVLDLEIGDKVVVDEHISCGLCYECRRGFPNRCKRIASLGMSCNGGFAEYTVVPAKQCYKIPSHLSLEKACLFEPLSNVYYALNFVRPQPHEKAVVFGAGPIGMLFVATLKLTGIDTIVVCEPSEYRRKFSRIFSPTRVVNPLEEEITEVVKEIAPEGVDISIDACGVPEVLKEAVIITKPHGKILLFGEQHNRETAFDFTLANRKELRFYGSDAQSFFAYYTIDLLQRKDFPVEKIITHRFPLEEIWKGIELMKSGETVKVLIFP